MSADGSQQTRVSGNLRMSANPSWSPNGKQILFATYAPASPGSDYFCRLSFE
jgi:Tol biopolymer transport system component